MHWFDAGRIAKLVVDYCPLKAYITQDEDCSMRWLSQSLVWHGLETDASEGDVITATIGTPAGRLVAMAEIDIDGRLLILRGVHVQAEGGANSVGLANLRTVMQIVLERTDCDEARVEGAPRTTGANPGRRPRVLRFTRDAGPTPV